MKYLIVLFLLAFYSSLGLAQITITPLKFNYQPHPGEIKKSFTINLSNAFSKEQELLLTLVEVGQDINGSLSFSPLEAKGIATFTSKVFLKPGEKNKQVTINFTFDKEGRNLSKNYALLLGSKSLERKIRVVNNLTLVQDLESKIAVLFQFNYFLSYQQIIKYELSAPYFFERDGKYFYGVNYTNQMPFSIEVDSKVNLIKEKRKEYYPLKSLATWQNVKSRDYSIIYPYATVRLESELISYYPKGKYVYQNRLKINKYTLKNIKGEISFEEDKFAISNDYKDFISLIIEKHNKLKDGENFKFRVKNLAPFHLQFKILNENEFSFVGTKDFSLKKEKNQQFTVQVKKNATSNLKFIITTENGREIKGDMQLYK